MALYTGTVLGFVTMLAVWFIAGAEKGASVIGGTSAQHGGIRRDDLVCGAGECHSSCCASGCRISCGPIAARSGSPVR